MTPKEQRRADMPITSAFWDAVVECFGMPEYFHATENGHQITYPPEEKREARL